MTEAVVVASSSNVATISEMPLNPWKTVSSTDSSLASPVHSTVSNGIDSGVSTAGDDTTLAVDLGAVDLGFDALPSTSRAKRQSKTKKANWKPLAVSIVTKDPKEGDRDIRGGIKASNAFAFEPKKNLGRKPPSTPSRSTSSASNFSQGRNNPRTNPTNNHAQSGNNHQINNQHARQQTQSNNSSREALQQQPQKESSDIGQTSGVVGDKEQQLANQKQSRSGSSGPPTRPAKFPEEPFSQPTTRTSQLKGGPNTSQVNNNPSNSLDKNSSHTIRGGNTSSSRQQTTAINGPKVNNDSQNYRRQGNYNQRAFSHNNGSEGGGFSTPGSSSGRATPNGLSPLMTVPHQGMEDFIPVTSDLQYYVDYASVVTDAHGNLSHASSGSPATTSPIMPHNVLAAVPAGVTVLPTPSFATGSPVPTVTATSSALNPFVVPLSVTQMLSFSTLAVLSHVLV